ncbi:MAG: ABC transporter permease [Deltaproteobacteria bacterium]|nr:ABC transporter permease [Deltaproteobacteria bacterium]
MMILETVRTAWRSLTSNRVRTALTGLGMVIGVAAVVAVLSVGEGAQSQVEGRIRSLGSNLLTVRPEVNRSGAVRSGTVQTLTLEDAEALRVIPGVAAVSPEVSGNAQVRYREQNQSASIMGVMPDYLQVRALEVAQGLSFTDDDIRERSRNAILGATVAKSLFPGESALGQRFQIKGIGFRVIGLLAEKGDSGFSSPDELVLIPITTHQGVVFGSDRVSSVGIAVQTESEMDAVQAASAQLLRLRHGLRDDEDDDVQIRSQTEMLATLSSVTGTFTALLGSVAAVSLLVGGIGIMNIMLVSVRERTREIGVRMAVGARRRDILLQFLVESIVVSLFGGLLGLGIGYGGAALIAKLGGWSTIVPSYAIAMSLGVSIAIGLLFGVGPARRAARLDPVEALRQE